jgi:hypothetical protein
MAVAWRMQRILQQHVGSGELVDDAEITFFAPKLREPTAYDGFVFFFFGHNEFLSFAVFGYKKRDCPSLQT